MPDFDFSTLITDRSASDLELLRDLLSTPMSDWTAEQLAQFNQAISKGAYNYTDLNRVTACMDYLNERLTALGYVTGYHPIIVHPATPPEPVGPLPEGYTELEYIESTGTQYIDTGFKPNQDTRVVMRFQRTVSYSAINGLFGARDVASGTAPQQFIFWNNGQMSFRTDYFGSQETISGLQDTGEYQVDKNKNVTTIGGSTTINPASTGQNVYDLFLFAVNNVGSADYFTSAKIYLCQVYNNGELIRDYVPCKNPTGEVGLYDLQTETFFGNQGTGTFPAGPVIDPPDPGPDPGPSKDPHTWYEDDTPTATQMARYLQNVTTLRGALELPEDTAQVPANMVGLTLTEANRIEEILSVIHSYLEAMITVFRRCGAAICGGPGFYFVN